MKYGYSLISALVSAVIILLGIAFVLTVIQNTERLFTRAVNYQDFAIAAEILNDKIQEEFSSAGSTVPEKIEGKMPGFRNLKYEINFHKIQDNLYEVRIKLTKIVEGKNYSEEFITSLHQR
ncbi:MAG: hypothetical protein NC906_06355 [Candidatus Omnitrophica bacterium]|nr:hypothetical protein [Candidatus Omnitrophota bacterium]